MTSHVLCDQTISIDLSALTQQSSTQQLITPLVYARAGQSRPVVWLTDFSLPPFQASSYWLKMYFDGSPKIDVSNPSSNLGTVTVTDSSGGATFPGQIVLRKTMLDFVRHASTNATLNTPGPGLYGLSHSDGIAPFSGAFVVAPGETTSVRFAMNTNLNTHYNGFVVHQGSQFASSLPILDIANDAYGAGASVKVPILLRNNSPTAPLGSTYTEARARLIEQIPGEGLNCSARMTGTATLRVQCVVYR